MPFQKEELGAHTHTDTQRGHVSVKEEMHARRFQRHGKDMKQVLAAVIRRNSPWLCLYIELPASEHPTPHSMLEDNNLCYVPEQRMSEVSRFPQGDLQVSETVDGLR